MPDSFDIARSLEQAERLRLVFAPGGLAERDRIQWPDAAFGALGINESTQYCWGSGGSNFSYRTCEGVARFVITDINNPSLSAMVPHVAISARVCYSM